MKSARINFFRDFRTSGRPETSPAFRKQKTRTILSRSYMIQCGFTKDLDIPYEKVIELVTEVLKKEGFGILTEINVTDKFHKKLGIDFKKYIILGACNPPYAHKAILAEENIGLMLPCNVIVYEKGNKTVLSIIKATIAMQMINNQDLATMAIDVESKLKNVFDTVR
jgi:uncharacterized protein (DUF302 family)